MIAGFDEQRLVLEFRAMKEVWGEAARFCRDDAGNFWWDVDIPVEGQTFPIRIPYARHHPIVAPEVISLLELPNDTPHLLTGNRLCYHYSGDMRSRNRWDPSKDTLAMVTLAAQRWLTAFLVWHTTGHWPCPDAGI